MANGCIPSKWQQNFTYANAEVMLTISIILYVSKQEKNKKNRLRLGPQTV